MKTSAIWSTATHLIQDFLGRRDYCEMVAVNRFNELVGRHQIPRLSQFLKEVRP